MIIKVSQRARHAKMAEGRENNNNIYKRDPDTKLDCENFSDALRAVRV